MIKGDSVILRSLEPEEMNLVNRWRNDPDVLREAYGEMLPPESVEQTRRWADGWVNTEFKMMFGVESHGQLIGFAQLFDMDWRVYRLAEHGIAICDRDFQSGPAGIDTLLTLNQYAFHGMNLNRLWLKMPIYMEPAALLLEEHLGYVREGLLRQQYYVAGRYIDTLVLGLLRTDFEHAMAKTPRETLLHTIRINHI